MPKERKPQRQSFNSVNSQVKANEKSGQVPDYPHGVNFITERDIELWRVYTSVRLISDWRDADLVNVVRMIRYENDIKELNATLDAEGLIVDEKEHPAVKTRNTITAQLIALQRMLNLNSLDSDARTVNAHGKKAAQQAKTKSKVSLLASLK